MTGMGCGWVEKRTCAIFMYNTILMCRTLCQYNIRNRNSISRSDGAIRAQQRSYFCTTIALLGMPLASVGAYYRPSSLRVRVYVCVCVCLRTQIERHQDSDSNLVYFALTMGCHFGWDIILRSHKTPSHLLRRTFHSMPVRPLQRMVVAVTVPVASVTTAAEG